jgi:alkylation response protein AidB-like acyl-CoA dehydrogenase
MSPDPRSPDLLSAIAGSAEALDRGQLGPACAVDALRDHGWLTAALPTAYGGRDWAQSAAGARDGFTALFLLGSASLPATRLFEGHLNAVRLIARHGSAAQRSAIFAQVRGGALLAIWGADGDCPASIADDRLAGTKTFASGLGEVALAIVTATDAHGGCQMVIVRADDTARWHKAAWDVCAMVGTCSGEFTLDRLPATTECRLGEPDALFVEPDFNGGVWRLCAAYAGGMAAISQLTLAHLQQRRSDEDPRMRARLGQIEHHSRTALLWAWHACSALEMPMVDNRQVERAIAASLFAREAIEHAATDQMVLVERIGGTALHRRGSALGRQLRDLRFFLRQAGLDAKLDAAFDQSPHDPAALLDDVLGSRCEC